MTLRSSVVKEFLESICKLFHLGISSNAWICCVYLDFFLRFSEDCESKREASETHTRWRQIVLAVH